jgi:hypothetical protein
MHRIHYGKGRSPSKNINVSSKDIMSALGDSIKAKRRLIKKSDNLSSLITYSAAALKKLFKDVNFRNQLKVENITEMPESVMEIIGSA